MDIAVSTRYGRIIWWGNTDRQVTGLKDWINSTSFCFDTSHTSFFSTSSIFMAVGAQHKVQYFDQIGVSDVLLLYSSQNTWSSYKERKKKTKNVPDGVWNNCCSLTHFYSYLEFLFYIHSYYIPKNMFPFVYYDDNNL